MLISLIKDPSSQPGDILAHVHVSASDNPPGSYSHSFRYKVPLGKEGKIIVYADQDAASKDVEGVAISFDLEKCRNKECKEKNPTGCPVIADKPNRLLVADVFHTMPTQNTIQYFSTALFKALFSGSAEQLLQITEPTDPNGAIFLLLDRHDDELDAIPWEYARNGAKFLVHCRKFARVLAPFTRPQDSLPQPLRIVVAAPDPLDLAELSLADLHLGDQFQNFINELRQDSIDVMLERVLPATVNKMNLLLAKSDDKVATVLHFMGHCIAHKDDNKVRGLLFENEDTFKCTIANTQNLVTVPTNLRFAYMSACNSREVARDLAKDGVRHTIGSYCPLPDDIARKSETQFYHYLVQGLSVDEAMWRTRISFQDSPELRQSDYLAGAMILYSTNCQTSDNIFLCKAGELKIELNMFLNNLKTIPTPRNFFGRKKELAKLNDILRRMATRSTDSFDICTITGIGSQGKTTLAIEAIHRTSHFFPGGIFVWQFNNEKRISAKEYLLRLADTIFPKSIQNDTDEVKNLGQVISDQFKASSLLILDHADALKHAAAEAEEDAVFLVDWLMEIISRKDIAVKILATSQEDLEWPGETVIPLDGFIDSDIHSGCKLFVENLNLRATKKIQDEKNSKHLLRNLVTLVDGHPLSLKLLAIATSSSTYLDKPLEDIIHEHCGAMLVDDNYAKKSLEDCFGPMIDRLPNLQRQILYLCCLFTGPITNRILLFINHFIDHSGTSVEDLCTEMISTQLQQLYDRGLLFKTEKNEEYRIHIALREAARQRNTELRLRLSLQTSGQYDEVFIIGVPTSSRPVKSIALEWLFHGLQSNASSRLKTKDFCIQYYSIGNAGCHSIEISSNDNNRAKATLPIQLIVFIYKISITLHDDLPRLCEDQVIPIVTKNKLPFILVLDNQDTVFDEGSSTKIKNSQMKKATEILRTILVEIYNIVITETPSGGKKVDKKLQSASTKSNDLDSTVTLRAYQKSLTSVYMEGDFVGREKELKTLNTLLHDDTHHYITIKGFGGMGKTCLALQAAKNFNSGDILALSLVGTPTLNSVIMKIAQFLGVDAQLDIVIEKLNSKDTVLFYLDNMEDIKNANDQGDRESKALMKFFRRMPKNVKILATSRIALDWPNEEIVELDGLTPHDGMQVFRQWISQRNGDVDDDSAMKLSSLVHGHSLSLRLLGGVFNNCKESIEQFLGNVFARLPKVVDNDSTVDRHESINACIEYSFNNLDPALGSTLGQLKAFEIPFTKTLAVRALGYDTISALELSVADALHQFWQRSWLNQRLYQVDPMLGDWRSKLIENDIEFYSLHPRLRDFLNEQFKNDDNANSAMSNDSEIQFFTALCYGIGYGVVNNLDKQIEWCTMAANNKHLEAQLILAVCYESGGGGVGEDPEKASYWYEKAAEAGDKGAQEVIGMRYLYGNGVQQDKKKYEYWRDCYEKNDNTPLDIKFDLSLPLIHRATEFGNLELVRSLMEQSSAEVNIRDRNGRTPLYVAAEKGHIDMVKLLVFEFNADINATKKDGMTPMHVAASSGHSDVVRLLMTELGADKDKKDINGGTLLHYAAKGDVVSLLVDEFRTDVNPKDDRRRTPLLWALQEGHIESVKLLMMKVLPTTLDFSGSSIGTKGARALAESLKQNTTLTELNLKENNIGDDGIRALAESLKQNVTLTKLDLEDNDFGFEGARALAESLMQNMTLTELNLSLTNINTEVLAEPLKRNTTLTKLNLSYNNIGAKEGCALAESLKQNTTINQLDLGNNEFGDKGALALAESLKQSTALAKLNLRQNEIGAEGAHALAGSLKQNITLTILNLESNKIGDEGACILAESLIKNMSLTELNLAGNDIGTEGAHILAESLKHNTILSKLNLGSNDIGAEGARTLVEPLKQNTNLTQLNIEANGIGAEGAHALAEFLKQNTTLTELNIFQNDIGSEGAHVLAESLKQNTSLTELNFGKNDIGAEGARVLAESLKQNMTLAKLDLGDNHTDDEGACALAEFLKQNTTLTELDLSYNEIGAEGARALAESLKQNTNLTQLNLDANFIGIEGGCALAEALKQNTTLTELNLYWNDIDAYGACALAESLKQNTTLMQLNLGDNRISDEGAIALAECLNQNTTLTELNLESNKISAKAVHVLAKSLEQRMTQTKLNLNGNDFDAEGVGSIADFLKQKINQTELDLDEKKIDARGARALAKFLKQNTTLTELYLNENDIGDEGARTIAESLKQNTTLTELTFSSNEIGTEGVRALAESLKQNTTLTELNLEFNHIDNNGAFALAEFLKQSTTLTLLSLENNQIGIEGVRALVESLKQNTTLTELNLSWNSVGIEGARIIAEFLKQNTTLTQLNLDDNEIGAEGAGALAESLKWNTTLTELYLGKNEIGAKGAHTLAEAMKQNTTLTQLNLEENKIDTESAHTIAESLNRNKALKKLFAESEAEANTNDNCRTSLHITELCRVLTEFEKDFEANGGLTPLHVIVAHGYSRLMELLVDEFKVHVNTNNDNGWTPLHLAAAHGDFDIVKLLITKTVADPHIIDKEGRTPLHSAVDGGNVEVVKLLLAELGAEVEAKDNDGRTPLHRASFLGHVELMRLLITKHKADVNTKAKDGQTPLHEAVKGKHFEVVRHLIEEFAADTKARDNNGWTPFRDWYVEVISLLVTEFVANAKSMSAENQLLPDWAVGGKKVEIMKLLVAKPDTDTNVKDDDRQTSIRYLSRDWYIEVTRLLLTEYGTDANAKDNDGKTPLHWAAFYGRVEIASLLTAEHGADVNTKDNSGQTPLHYATCYGHIEVARLLLKRGADANAKLNNGEVPLHWTARNGHIEIIKLLLAEHGADVNAKNNNGETPLHFSLMAGHIDVAKLLVEEFSADINSRGRSNGTPLHYVSSEGRLELARFLIVNLGADVHAKDKDGDEPLQWAVGKGHVDTVRMFVEEFEADVDTKNIYGRIPLHYAASYGHAEMVNALVCEFGADLNVEDKEGLTPLQLAEQNRHEEVVNLIKNGLGAHRSVKKKNSKASADKTTPNMQAQDASSTNSIIAPKDKVTKFNEQNRDDDSHNKSHRRNRRVTAVVLSTSTAIIIGFLLWRRFGAAARNVN